MNRRNSLNYYEHYNCLVEKKARFNKDCHELGKESLILMFFFTENQTNHLNCVFDFTVILPKKIFQKLLCQSSPNI